MSTDSDEEITKKRKTDNDIDESVPKLSDLEAKDSDSQNGSDNDGNLAGDS
jgi:hypothetical protein